MFYLFDIHILILEGKKIINLPVLTKKKENWKVLEGIEKIAFQLYLFIYQLLTATLEG